MLNTRVQTESVPDVQDTPVGSTPTETGHETVELPAVQTHVLPDTPGVHAQSVFVVCIWSTLKVIEHELFVAKIARDPSISQSIQPTTCDSSVDTNCSVTVVGSLGNTTYNCSCNSSDNIWNCTN